MATKKEKELLLRIKELKQELNIERDLRKKHVVKMYKNNYVLIVSNRLPVTLHKDPVTLKWSTSSASGGLVSAMSSLKLKRKWIGWIGLDIDENDKPQINMLLEKINCVPVYLPKELYEAYYNGFSNDVLWPILHYVQLPITTSIKEKEYWIAYNEVNRIFANVVEQNCTGHESVWVHDYHLMVLPKILRERGINSQIGWFLHTPFPNSDIFRTLSYRAELLKGVLASDLLGFHIYDYVQNFKNTCIELLGCDSGADAIDYNGKLTLVDAFPIGIDIDKFEDVKKSMDFGVKVDELRKRYGDAKIILGVDRLDYIKGIMHKLVALERVLQNNQEWLNKFVYLQIAVPTRTEVAEYQKLTENVHELVGRINGKFSNLTHVPIHYMDKSIDLGTLTALYSIADICLITSLRDGMNLVSYEYIASQTESPGVLILSEFVGASQSLGAGSIQINPWNISEVSTAIVKALEMDEKKKRKMFDYAYKYVTNHSSQNWGDEFMHSLKQSWEIRNFLYKEPKIPTQLDFDHVRAAYYSSKKRFIFIGVAETLTSATEINEKESSGKVKQLNKTNEKSLRALANDDKTTLVIATSRRKEMVDVIFGDIPVILCAENGYYLKNNRIKTDWIKNADLSNLSWIESTEKVMTYFVERTPKSFIERFESSIYWHYKKCSGLFAARQARDLISNLQAGPLINTPTEVLHDQQNMYIQVRLFVYNKTRALIRAFDYLFPQKTDCSPKKNKDENGDVSPENTALARCRYFDFVLCIGSYYDSDQDVFVSLNENITSLNNSFLCENQPNRKLSENSDKEISNRNIFTVSVGKKKSLANQYLKNSKEVEQLLQYLSANNPQ